MNNSLGNELRFATTDELARWNDLVKQLPGGGEVWQSREYALAKRYQKYTDLYVVGQHFPATLVLEKRVPLLGKLWYVPGGPVAEDAEATLAAAQKLADFARKSGAFLLKTEPRLLLTDPTIQIFKAAGFTRGTRILPNESTILVDISGEDQEVMSRFSSSTRTRIRKADRIGFEVRRVEATEEHCRTMYGLLGETGEGRFLLRPYEYYRNFWQIFQQAGHGQLFLGYHEGQAVAGMFGTSFGLTSGYKDGASTKHNVLPNGAMYRMQWELILWARELGAQVHDLIGTPPSDRLDDRSHHFYGVGQYKLRLSKNVVDYVGILETPLRKNAAKIWAVLGDRVARRMSLAMRKDPYY